MPLDGAIALVEPTDGYSALSPRVEFKWRWPAQNSHCDPLPAGVGFEIRIWANPSFRPGAVPMGAMNAREEQLRVQCDPDTGIRLFVVDNISFAPGVSSAGTDKLLWDVALVNLEPYGVIKNSEPVALNFNQ